jgi:hypothetical protein
MFNSRFPVITSLTRLGVPRNSAGSARVNPCFVFWDWEYLGRHREWFTIVGSVAIGRKMNRFLPLIVVAACFSLSAQAESPNIYKPPRSSDGHVEFEGIWKNSNLTPLERPEKIGHAVLTAAEAAALTREYFDAGSDGPDDPGRTLESRSYEAIGNKFRSSVIIDPADGKLPWADAHLNDQKTLRRGTMNAFDNPEDRPPPERCLASTASPPLIPTLDNNLFHIVQTPQAIAIVSELIHDARIVRMHSSHSPEGTGSWLGDSIDWWEKDALVVETSNFAPHSAVRNRGRDTFLVSAHTVVVERFRRVSENEINYVFTVTDPALYSRSWTGETHLLKSSERMFEYACHEGNYSMRNILQAARDSEAAAVKP